MFHSDPRVQLYPAATRKLHSLFNECNGVFPEGTQHELQGTNPYIDYYRIQHSTQTKPTFVFSHEQSMFPTGPSNLLDFYLFDGLGSMVIANIHTPATNEAADKKPQSKFYQAVFQQETSPLLIPAHIAIGDDVRTPQEIMDVAIRGEAEVVCLQRATELLNGIVKLSLKDIDLRTDF